MTTATALCVQFADTPSSMPRAIHAVLQHSTKKGMTLTDVMGYSSYAFRINVREHSIDTDSPY